MYGPSFDVMTLEKKKKKQTSVASFRSSSNVLFLECLELRFLKKYTLNISQIFTPLMRVWVIAVCMCEHLGALPPCLWEQL